MNEIFQKSNKRLALKTKPTRRTACFSELTNKYIKSRYDSNIDHYTYTCAFSFSTVIYSIEGNTHCL